jgi:1,4-alpha-glucan branching enzyme
METNKSETAKIVRRLPVGAEVVAGGVHFRVWADCNERVDVVLGKRLFQLQPEGDGYFSGLIEEAGVGQTYFLRLNGKEPDLPDPASRFQPDGPLGPSEIVDPSRFVWSDGDWRGVVLPGQVMYEMHIGTFTPEGTFAAARRQLGELADLGVTVIELMPLAEFPGRFGWGYDGVHFFAPNRFYGSPDDVRGFVDEAHARGIGVILGVVCNHYGPCETVFTSFSNRYGSDRYTTDWGTPPNFDGPGSGPVREYFIANAGYWISEFHMDGLRLDATQNIYDAEGDLWSPGYFRVDLCREENAHLVASTESWESIEALRPEDAAAAERDRRTRLMAESDPRTHDGIAVELVLIGPFVDAWLRVYPDDRQGAARFLLGFDAHLNEACVGTISEVFDAESPYTPRGCAAQAWSVAEVLRAWVKTESSANR